ncbi:MULTISPECIES: alpha/beta hydrolase [Niastella]|uniref:Lysophospholipase n=1 Tax=Niastella soli TaxID=2821487 RepID=A0ABS3Z2G6_9BACT|nr:alpha/beta hydrolase [Niastella soli]MBO9204320.1 lysophospholipase [Niastella soli]
MQSKQTVSTFRNAKGQNIFYRNWSAGSISRGIILIIHGLNAHSGYYQSFATQLNENNFEVYALDLCGRGQSDGERYYMEDYNDTLADIDLLLNIINAAHPTLPVFLLGHSAGGVFASIYALQYQDKLRGLISESFAFQVSAPGVVLAVIKLLSHIIPHTRLVKLNNEDFSRDKAIVVTMNNDPLLAKEKQPAKTMQQLLLATEYLKEEMQKIKLPILVLHGTADSVTKPGGSEYFMEHASSVDKQLNLYEGHYHDLINDKYHGIVFRDIIRWINERV